MKELETSSLYIKKAYSLKLNFKFCNCSTPSTIGVAKFSNPSPVTTKQLTFNKKGNLN